MFSIQDFLKNLDQLFESGQTDRAEAYLLDGLRQTDGKDPRNALILLNELIGYYRSTSRYAECAQCAQRALKILEQQGLLDTVSHATTLLNAATGDRAAGNYEQSEQRSLKALEILNAQISGPDERIAAVCNNLGQVYAQTGRMQQAYEQLDRAMQIIRQVPGRAAQLAVTSVNLGNVCLSLGRRKEAEQHLQKAIEIFEAEPGAGNPHYPAALSAMGELYVADQQPEQAQACYERALVLLEQLYGRNDDWQTTSRNLEVVRQLCRKKKQLTGHKGMELSRAYYQEVGKPMLEAKYPGYVSRIAVGLAGEGSECFGFDDDISVDHDFGPGFCLWLTKADYAEIGEKLQKDYDALPRTWKGIPVRSSTVHGVRRVGVLCIDEFFRTYTGVTAAPAAKTMEDIRKWAVIPAEMLATVTNGAVFEDPLGEFTRRRAQFSEIPEPVRIWFLAKALHELSQAGQYNYSRACRRNAVGMQYACLAEFTRAAAEAGYWLNRRYPLFYKWRLRGMESFARVPELKDQLQQIMVRKADDPEMEERIEEICATLLEELRSQSLTDSPEPFLDAQKEILLKKLRLLLHSFQDAPSQEVKDLSYRIIATEWQQFQRVNSEGGRAGCQNNWPTFEIMRKSQFYTWKPEVLRSYLADLQQAEADGWNLITEKYARMMESTAPEAFKALASALPPRDAHRLELQEQLVKLMGYWRGKANETYPTVMGLGRPGTTALDGNGQTSSETYLRGELGTYSDRTLELYADMLLEAASRNENPVVRQLEYTARLSGFDSLADAEEKKKKD